VREKSAHIKKKKSKRNRMSFTSSAADALAFAI
jgi:hypothetical protein